MIDLNYVHVLCVFIGILEFADKSKHSSTCALNTDTFMDRWSWNPDFGKDGSFITLVEKVQCEGADDS